jgi:hypothetical protein
MFVGVGIRGPGTSAIAHARELLERTHIRRSQVGPWLGQKHSPGQVTVVDAITSGPCVPSQQGAQCQSGVAPPWSTILAERVGRWEGKTPTLW